MRLVVDVKQFREQLKKLPKKLVDNVTKKTMRRMSQETVKMTKADTPVETRLLQKSLSYLVKYYPAKKIVVARIGARTNMARYVKITKVKNQRMHAKNFNYERKQLEATYKAAVAKKYDKVSNLKSRLRREMKSPKMQKLASRAGMVWRNPAHYFHLQELGTKNGVSAKYMLTNALSATRYRYYDRLKDALLESVREVTGK